MVKRAPPSLASGVAIWTRVRVQWLLGQWREGSMLGRLPFRRGYPPGGMLNRVDIGAFPSNRWYRSNHYVMALGRAGPKGSTAGSKEGEVVLSLLLNEPLPPGAGCLWHGLVGLSGLWKHCWTLASLMVAEQQFSTSAMARE